MAKYFFDADIPPLDLLYGVSIAQYAKGVEAYLTTSKHIKKNEKIDRRFVSKMPPCYRLGMRCAARNHNMLDKYKDITSRL